MSQQTQNELHEEEEEESPLALASQQTDEWVELTNHPDYEINVNYPHQIRNSKTKRIIKERYEQGYIKVHLNLKSYAKHRIIAEQFIENDDPENKTEIDHINTIRDDNHIQNLRWCTSSSNARNKAGYNSIKAEYVDNLPSDAIKITFYKGIEFEGYYYSKSTQKCYYDNGVRYRTLLYHSAPSKMIYVRAIDVERKTRCIYIKAWLRDEGVE